MADVTNVQVGVCSVVLNGVDLGHTRGGVEYTYEPEYFEVTVDKYGNTPVDEILIGEKIEVKVPLAEFTIANMGIAIPQGQFAGAANGRRTFGAVSGKKASDVAYELVLHPINAGNLDYDIVLYKAFVESSFTLSHMVDDVKVIEVTFKAILDESKSDRNYLGMIGDSTA